jgi:transcriptional regulator with XRE-family HTH domain
MSNGGKHLKELIKSTGRTLEWVAEAINVSPQTITRWTNNAPIGKLYEISKVAGIPILEIIECFNPDRDELIPADQTGGDNN